ncbi:hypothetical protein LH20_12090 [Sphingopyxis sp. 113P3]|nr:hypothetical protein LH20_12090 [Sphingopyxis sp. 113P3]
MDLGLHDLCQFAYVPECRLQLSSVFCLDIASHEIFDPSHHGAKFPKVPERPVSAFRQVYPVLAIKQAFDKALEFLPADLGESGKILG